MENSTALAPASQLVSSATISPVAAAAREYITDAGFTLCAIPAGAKGPTDRGWNLRTNACTSAHDVAADYCGNIGLLHAWARTCALDLDDFAAAHALLAESGVDLTALLSADDAVQIRSGRTNSGKLLYRLPEGTPPFASRKIMREGRTIYELRCADASGNSFQDVLPPSIHPTGTVYEWAGAGDWRELPECPSTLLALVAESTNVLEFPRSPATDISFTPSALKVDAHTRAELRSALNALDADDRDTWIKVGMALHELGDDGRMLWLDWSQMSEKWKPADARKWSTFKDSRSGYRAIFGYANAAGWTGLPAPAAAPILLFDGASLPAPVSASAPAVRAANAKPGLLRPFVQCATDLMRRTFDPVRWAIRDFIPEGVSLLVGAPKLGKSWLTLQCGIAISGGATLWPGREAEARGEVLMLALEDNDRRLQSRLTKLQQARTEYSIAGAPANSLGTALAPDVSGIHFATEWPRADEGGILHLDAWLGEHPGCRLVIIDTLAKFRTAKPDRNRSAYENDYAVTGPLKALADRRRVAIVLVHHTRKQEGADPLDAVSGTQGLSGGVDAILILKRERGAGDGALYVTGRDIEQEEDYALRFDTTTCTWGSLGTVEDVQRSRERTEILQYLREHGDGSPKQVAEGVGKKVNAVQRLLGKMVQDGSVEQSFKRYHLPGTGKRPDSVSAGASTSPPWR